MTIIVSVNCINMSSSGLRCDQSTQVSFPVLGQVQKRALRRYATLADINRPPGTFRGVPPHILWNHNSATNGSTFNGQRHHYREARPKSLQSLDLPLLQPLSTLQPGGVVGGGHSPLSLTPSGFGGNTPSSRLAPISCDASDISHSPQPPMLYTQHIRAVHHSKWRIGVESGESVAGSCAPAGPGRPCNTPEDLSWRRLHMSRAKLKATATTSELLSGFAMVAMVELQINEPTTVPEWLFVLFAVCTTILVAVHIFALMISTYILPNIDAISKLDVCELVTESPHERMRGFIELAWAFSTVLGLFLFLVEIAILCWVKFWDYSFTAAIAATVIVIPVLVMFVAFAVHFYHSLVVHKCDASSNDMQQLEDMKRSLDQAVSPV